MKNSPKNFYNVVDKKKLGIDEIAAVAGDVAELKSDVSGIETTLGNADSGLIKQVNNLQTTVDNIDYDISRKADIDGTYPDMTVGNADQLNSTQMITDKVPYVFRTSGGTHDIGNREYDQLVGGSIAWNQLVNTTDTSITVQSGHKLVTFISGSWDIIQSDGNAITVDGSTDMVFDITIMFGSSVADAIYAMETDTAGNGVSYFRNLFPKTDYAYDPGTIMSVKAIAHEMVGFNQFDEATAFSALGNITKEGDHWTGTIANWTNSSTGTGKSGWENIRYLEKTVYYFAAKVRLSASGTTSVKIRVTYTDGTSEESGAAGTVMQGNTGVTYLRTNGEKTVKSIRFTYGSGNTGVLDVYWMNINLSWNGYRNGEYEPYVKYSYVLDQDLELRGIAKVDGNGNIYYDGDTYSSDGTVIRNYEIRAYASGDESLPDAITDGTNTVVKLDTPVEESADPFQDPQWVDDFGTEEYVDTRAIPIPVGHITQYPANLRDKLQHLPSPTGVNGDYIIREATEVMTLVPAPTGVPELPSVNGTYVLTCTVSDGTATLSWTSNA